MELVKGSATFCGQEKRDFADIKQQLQVSSLQCCRPEVWDYIVHVLDSESYSWLPLGSRAWKPIRVYMKFVAPQVGTK